MYNSHFFQKIEILKFQLYQHILEYLIKSKCISQIHLQWTNTHIVLKLQ